MRKLIGIFTVAGMALLVASCGGGGSGGSYGGGASSSSSSSVSYSSNATAAQLTIISNVTDNTVTLNWVDSFPAGTVYTVQAVSTGATDSPQANIGGSGSNKPLSWTSNTLSALVTYRVDAIPPGGSAVPLKTPSGATLVSRVTPSPTPTIQTDKTQPVSGDVQLTLTPSGIYTPVDWTIDGMALGTTTTATNAQTWHTDNEASGVHDIAARSKLSTDAFIQAGLKVNVQNPYLFVTVLSSVSGADWILDVSPSPVGNVTSVSLSVDGTATGSLAAPNQCLPGCGGISNDFQFKLVRANLSAGNHVVIATATDSGGHSVRRISNVTLP